MMMSMLVLYYILWLWFLSSSIVAVNSQHRWWWWIERRTASENQHTTTTSSPPHTGPDFWGVPVRKGPRFLFSLRLRVTYVFMFIIIIKYDSSDSDIIDVRDVDSFTKRHVNVAVSRLSIRQPSILATRALCTFFVPTSCLFASSLL